VTNTSAGEGRSAANTRDISMPDSPGMSMSAKTASTIGRPRSLRSRNRGSSVDSNRSASEASIAGNTFATCGLLRRQWTSSSRPFGSSSTARTTSFRVSS
jgi:hypothetical protein